MMLDEQVALQAAPAADTGGAVALSFAATGWTILFERCPDVAAGVERIFRVWEPSRREPRQAVPDLKVTRLAGGYAWHAPGRPRPKLLDERPPRTPMNMISDIHDAFIDWYLAEHPNLFCLHAAAVLTPAGLVCFPSLHKAGKSTLCAQMIAGGSRLYGDDVLPLDPATGMAVALGLPPLLRLPLPSSLPVDTAAFINEHAGPRSRDWLYLCLRTSEIAAPGVQAPIAAFVLLKRRGRSAKLKPTERSTVLSELIMQNLVNKTASHQVLDCMAGLVERAPCYELVYSDPAEASRLLTMALNAKPS
jgi:hypothetical protein